MNRQETLLLNTPTDVINSLHNYLMALRLSTATWMITTTLDTLDKLEGVYDQLLGIKRVRALLLLGLFFHPSLDPNSQDGQDLINHIKSNLKVKTGLKKEHKDQARLTTPVVIIAGSSSDSIDADFTVLRQTVIQAFRNYRGILISLGEFVNHGTLAGDIKEQYPNNVTFLGYIPHLIPSTDLIQIDPRIDISRHSEGQDYTILEVLQYWYDLLNAGIDPGNVKLIGFDGGTLTALETRIAIAFGAQVGIIEKSGGAAAELINDEWWKQSKETREPKRLFKILPQESEVIQNFIERPFIRDPDVENLQSIIISNTENTTLLYTKDFVPLEVSMDILSGFLNAFEGIGEEIKAGGLLSLEYTNLYFTAGHFVVEVQGNTRDFPVFLILREIPSERLRKKIKALITRIDEELGTEFFQLAEQLQVYHDADGTLEEIFLEIFGPEMSKLL